MIFTLKLKLMKLRYMRLQCRTFVLPTREKDVPRALGLCTLVFKNRVITYTNWIEKLKGKKADFPDIYRSKFISLNIAQMNNVLNLY